MFSCLLLVIYICYCMLFLTRITLAGLQSLPRHEQNIHEVKIMEGFWHNAQSEWDLELNFNLEQCNLSGLQLFWARADQSSGQEAEVCQYQEATYWASVSSTALYLLHIVPANVQHKSSIRVIHLTRRSCLKVLDDGNPVAFTSSVTEKKTIFRRRGLKEWKTDDGTLTILKLKSRQPKTSARMHLMFVSIRYFSIKVTQSLNERQTPLQWWTVLSALYMLILGFLLGPIQACSQGPDWIDCGALLHLKCPGSAAISQ